jgi:RNA polymerase sigma factor (sigma-70 family)
VPIPDFSAVYDDHVERVYGFFSYRLRGGADVEDLTQQTFERALRAWGRYDPERASIATWLLVIARNLLIDHLRSSRLTRERSLDDLRADDAALTATPDRHDLGLPADLERALRELGERERELIALRFGGDLSCPEIAALTGLTLANVQQILSRSLRRMRSSLERRRAHSRV